MLCKQFFIAIPLFLAFSMFIRKHKSDETLGLWIVTS